MVQEIRVKDVQIVAVAPGFPEDRVMVRTLDGDTLTAKLVDRDSNLLLANYRDSVDVWHPIEIEHPSDPVGAVMRFRDYPGEVVWSFGVGEPGRPRAWRSGIEPGRKSSSPFSTRYGPSRGQIWESEPIDHHDVPEAPKPAPEAPTEDHRAYGSHDAEAELAALRADPPGGPAFDTRIRLLARFFLWSNDDVSKWVGTLLANKAEHIRFTGATTPAAYEDRLDAIRREAEAEQRSRIRSAPPEEPEGHW